MNTSISSFSSASVADTIRAAFPFSVDKYRLQGPEGMRTDHFGLFRSDTLDCVGAACKEGYMPHSVDDVVMLAEAGAEAFDSTAKVSCTWKNGHVVSIAPSDDYRRSIYGTNDNIFPRLIISAGYDGAAFKGSLGLYRDACRNLQMLQTIGQSISCSIRHTDSLRDRIADIVLQFRNVASQWERIGEFAARMERETVALDEFVSRVYPDAENASTRTQNAQERRARAIVSRVMRERLQTGRPEINSRTFEVSVWEAFNGVQGYAQHDQNRRGKPNEFDRAILAMNDNAVKRAEELAVELLAA